MTTNAKSLPPDVNGNDKISAPKEIVLSAIQDLTVGVIRYEMLRQYAFPAHMQPDPGSQISKPGDSVPATGLYSVWHTKEHWALQEVLLMVNDVFPQCGICEATVQYRLVRAAPYVSEDPDFKDA